MATLRSYRDLIVWQKAMALAEATYQGTSGLPKEETYGLRAQMTRAVVSIPANIAEGQARHGTKEFLQFLGIARGSLAELETMLMLCDNLKLIPSKSVDSVMKDCDEVGRLLNALIN